MNTLNISNLHAAPRTPDVEPAVGSIWQSTFVTSSYYILTRVNSTQQYTAINLETGCAWSAPAETASAAVSGLAFVAENVDIALSNEPAAPKPAVRWFEYRTSAGELLGYHEFVGQEGRYHTAGFSTPSFGSIEEVAKIRKEVFSRPQFAEVKKTRWFIPDFSSLLTGNLGDPKGFYEFVGTEGSFLSLFRKGVHKEEAAYSLDEAVRLTEAGKWREVSERPVLTADPKPATRWFVPLPGSLNFDEVSFIEFVGNEGTWHNKDGSTEESIFSPDYFAIRSKCYREVTERPEIKPKQTAEQVKPATRFFRLKGGFPSGELYIETRGDTEWRVVHPDRERGFCSEPWGYPLKFCLDAVNRGQWEEITVRRFRDTGPDDKKVGLPENPVEFVEFIAGRPGISVYRDGTRSTEFRGQWGTVEEFTRTWVGPDAEFKNPETGVGPFVEVTV